MKPIKFCIYVLAFAMLFACQANTAEEGQKGKQQSLRAGEQVSDLRNKETKSAEEIAEHLVHLTERVPEVNSATAIVLGDLAVVGIDVNAKIDRSDVGVVKYEVAEALSHDPHGAYAFITADPDINSRLKEMRKDIEAGHPISGIMDELAGIVGRMIPVIPGAEHKKADPEPTDENNKKLSEGKEHKLENIQEEQGKRNMDDNGDQKAINNKEKQNNKNKEGN